MKELSPYENYQLLKYGNVILETPDNSTDSKEWFERESEVREVIEQEN